jgi:hypothetical protein
MCGGEGSRLTSYGTNGTRAVGGFIKFHYRLITLGNNPQPYTLAAAGPVIHISPPPARR